MTATRTIAIWLPDDPNASAWDILGALNLTVGQLGANGDFHSAAIVANLVAHLRTPNVLPGDPEWVVASTHQFGHIGLRSLAVGRAPSSDKVPSIPD